MAITGGNSELYVAGLDNASVSRVRRVTGCPATQFAHDVVGADARRQLEAPTRPRNGVVHILAQDDAATIQFHFQGRALAQSQGVTYRLGQGDLATFCNGRFHGLLLKVCSHNTYF